MRLPGIELRTFGRSGQKRAPDLITDGCEPPCGCRELNSGPLEEQAMLLTSEPSLQPLSSLYNSSSLQLCALLEELYCLGKVT
ncbi:hypothetical protein ACRRTK_015764 [Alexandromys fortis]